MDLNKAKVEGVIQAIYSLYNNESSMANLEGEISSKETPISLQSWTLGVQTWISFLHETLK